MSRPNLECACIEEVRDPINDAVLDLIERLAFEMFGSSLDAPPLLEAVEPVVAQAHLLEAAEPAAAPVPLIDWSPLEI